MTHEELLESIAEVQLLQSELDNVEVKSGRGGTPQRLYEPLSAFTNRTGGVILFGLDESHSFEIIGVGNAHRDYSHFVRGSYIQIRLFADRLEIQSPGGLYGNVTVETLEKEQSTRNRVLMRLMEDLHLVENRGSGIRMMLEAMRRANLEPPRFQDHRSSFWVTFRSHTLMSPRAIAWLNQFAHRPLNDRQRLALVYLRHNAQMTNSDYQRLNHIDSATANRELRGLVQTGLIEQHTTMGVLYTECFC
jgi:ATP-dependent DNA helicase RecG